MNAIPSPSAARRRVSARMKALRVFNGVSLERVPVYGPAGAAVGGLAGDADLDADVFDALVPVDFGLGSGGFNVGAGSVAVNGDAGAAFAAEKLVERDAEAFGFDVPEGGIDAAEAVHDVLADDRAARLEHAGHDSCVEIRREPIEGEAAEAHRHASDGDVVFVTDRLAGQQTI